MHVIRVIAVICLLAGCSPLWEDGDYQVYYIDGSIHLGIRIDDDSYHRRVPHKVVAVGANQKFIVAKQQDEGDNSISYYYINREQDNHYLDEDDITQGPFSEERFLELSKELGLPDFSKNL